MDASGETCPSLDILQEALRGLADAETQGAVESHLTHCERCRGRVDEIFASDLSGMDTERLAALETWGEPEDDPHLTTLLESVKSDRPRNLARTPHYVRSFLSPSKSPGSLGKFGPYEILGEVAVGPMALVFKAYESALDRIVAVKALSPTLAQSESARERFLREARAMASIRHRNVIPVYAVDTEVGLPYLVMPFIDGPTLQERLTDGEALTLGEFLLVAEQLTAALVAAHGSGVIHRDIKPSNILLEEGLSHILLSDFGLARASEDKSVTRTGEIAGTPQFMSPEQARGEKVDQRTDLFSLGSVFYYLLVGRPPFDSDTALGAIRKVVEEDPEPIEKLRPGTPKVVVAWTQRLLSKDREKRFQSAVDVHEALVSYLRSKGSWKPADGTRSRRKRAAVVGAARGSRPRALRIALALALCVFGVYLSDRSGRTALINKALCRLLDREYYVRGEMGAYSSLKDAIAAAAEFGIVEIFSSATLEIEPVVIDRSALTIRAAFGSNPTFDFPQGADPVFTVYSPVVFEGIEWIESQRRLSEVPVVVARDAPVYFMNCRFDRLLGRVGSLPTWNPIRELIGIGARARQGAGPYVIQTEDASEVQLINCEFRGGSALVARYDTRGDASSIHIEGSAFLGRTFLTLMQRKVGALEVNLWRNTCISRMPLFFNRPESAYAIEVGARSNLMLSHDHLLGTFAGTPEELGRRVDWSGRDNVCESVEEFVLFVELARRSPGVERSLGLEVWNKIWDQPEDNTIQIDSKIEDRLRGVGSSEVLESIEDWRREVEEVGPKVGADAGRVGPGEPYHRWRRTSGYRDWRFEINEHIADWIRERGDDAEFAHE